ncbi:unnamed protein product [Mytilus edulis]|uniref:Death domain-containing protein n=1 Tax=Mytilus edulis TaxID=6550 RepID=A0A8S3SI65_MYTED|nr:unnamed protein product [Mytilus edulis]
MAVKQQRNACSHYFSITIILEYIDKLRQLMCKPRNSDTDRCLYNKRHLRNLLSADLVPSFDSRILVVGAYEAGKTTLVENLIGNEIPRDRQSTDGIDVYFGKLLFDLMTQTLMQNPEGVHSFPKAIYQKVSSYLKSKKEEITVQESDVFSVKTQSDIPDEEVIQQLSENFAGQIVYHVTHQTFITSHGIYLITFNGSRNLDDPLSIGKGERIITILDNIRQWVSSILMYSHPDCKDYPKVMFVATHKDLVCQNEIPKRRSQLLDRLSACFTDEKTKSHLMLEKLVFVNARNNNEPEMEELKDSLSKTITEKSTLGTTSTKTISYSRDVVGKALDVPDAIPSRLIACMISIWNIRRHEHVELLFPDFVAVVLDRKHDLVVKTERNTVAVYLVHKERKGLIIKDLASSVRQCLEQNLARISEVYSVSFTSKVTSKKYVPFELKLKHGCLSQGCLLDAGDIGESKPNGYVKTMGILDAALSMLPNDAQLLRLCNCLTKEDVRSLAVNLGISNPEFDAIDADSTSMLKFYSLRICREKNKSCKDFVKAMEAAEINGHTMCQILRQAEVLTELPDKILNLPPSDEMLDKLCLRIGKEWMVLGLELGLEIERLEQIEYETVKVLREVSRQVLYCWRNRDDNATTKELLYALARSGRNPQLITEILENCDSYPNIIPVD